MTITTMAQLTALLVFGAQLSLAQAATPASTAASARPSAPIPKHLFYAHFMAMVNEFDKGAVAANDPDPYKFAQPFSRAGLENADLDSLLEESKALASDLAAQDQKASLLISDYRARGNSAAQQGQPLPPLPIGLRQLQADRTAIAINHMLNLRTALGKEKTQWLEAYFAREVAPHVSLKVLAHPPAVANASNAAQSFAVQQ